jgi:single-stranded-DNA-specific exonuclease
LLVDIPDCDWDAVRGLQSDLGLDHLAAQTLVRRGLGDSESVRRLLTDESLNPPSTLPGASAAAAVIVDHVGRGSRIAVHGDYDVDGVCSTAILVRALAGLGANVTWHVPSRFGDGYGLTMKSVQRLADDDVELIVTVDCGVGSLAEVAHAKQLGIDVVICDHHTFGDELPEAPVVHPGLGGYPDPQLCAAATTYKLASLVVELAGGSAEDLESDLALVALATVCDMVPLVGENRALVRLGLVQMRQTQRPGLCELMRVAGLDQLRITASSFGFGLGPRINAAGRMHSAEPAVELMLTESSDRAAELAAGLGAANHRRREIEQETLIAAEAQAAEQADQYAIVVAGEEWHPGVLGIVAGRIADRYHRPAVALTISDGVASGSGRSGGTYDLHGGLARCGELLDRFGGHRAAAGLELKLGRLSEFRSMLSADAAEALTPDDLRPRLRIDAVAGPADIKLETVAALEQLGPFGAENPSPLLLLAGVKLTSVARLGSSGQHFKLAIEARRDRAAVVAFRQERAIRASDPAREVDLVVELQRNEFNGREEAQAVLRGIVERELDPDELWREEFERALVDPPFSGGGEGIDPQATHDRRGQPLAEVLLEFGSSDRPVTIAANDPVPLRSEIGGADGALSAQVALEVIAYDDPRILGQSFDCVVMSEPPPSPSFARFAGSATVAAWSDEFVLEAGSAPGSLLPERAHVIAVYRAVRDGGDELGGTLRRVRAECASARIAGRSLRVLEEIGVVELELNDGSVDRIAVREIGKVELDQSVTFRSYSEYREESSQWLHQLSTETRSK